MKYYIIAGEASGDLHASNLMKELNQEDAAAQFRFWGGDRMQQQGGELVKHYKDLAFMGFLEVLLNLRTILGNIRFCKEDILRFQPDVVILVDYPGFNLRIAKFLHQQGIQVFYYISPQVWAWHSSRVKGIKKIVDRMFVILPFEEAFYKAWSYEVDFVGHPLLDAIANRKESAGFRERNQLDERPIIALLPGSRKQEIQKMLPTMLSIVHDFPDHQFVVAGLKHIDEAFYRQLMREAGAHLIWDQTYELLENAHAAVVTSGTATLETALFGVPEVVCYKGSFLSYLIGRWLVNVDFIALVNLVMGRELVEELIQSDFNYKRLKSAVRDLLKDEVRQELGAGYKGLREKLGGSGASARTAKLMLQYLKDKN